MNLVVRLWRALGGALRIPLPESCEDPHHVRNPGFAKLHSHWNRRPGWCAMSPRQRARLHPDSATALARRNAERQHVLDEMRRRRHHLPSEARRAEPSTLARGRERAAGTRARRIDRFARPARHAPCSAARDMRLSITSGVACSILVAGAARADEPEPTPILPSWPAPAPVAAQRQPVRQRDPEVTAPPAPRRSTARFGTGIAVTAIGGVALFGGLYALAWGESDRPSFYFWTTKKDEGLATAGAITAIVGAVLLAVGIPLMIYNGKRVPPKTVALRPSPDGLSVVF